MKVVIITGMSGAGRSRAADWFEDQGYYCVDNMPPALVGSFLEMASHSRKQIDRVAFVTDLRSGGFFDELSAVIDELRSEDGIELTVIFIEAAVAEIVKRYNEVRRLHPLSEGEVSAAVIEGEKERLRNIRSKADIVLDTTNLKVSELGNELSRLVYGEKSAPDFAVNITSFGFKYGIPSEADVMFDVRFLPNPYYVPSLRKLTGNNKKVVEHIFRSELAEQFVDSVHELLNSVLCGFVTEGKHHLNIAFGCTGGHHRSVAVANAVAQRFREDGLRVKVSHRDLELQNRKL